MLNEFISGITTNAYLQALIYLALWFVILRVSVFVIERILIKLTVKTKTNLDDLIIEKINKPLTLLVLLIGLKISFGKLPLSEIVITNVQLVLNSIMVLAVMNIIMSILTLAFSRVWKKLAKKSRTKPHDAMMQLAEGTIKVILVISGILYILGIWGVEIGPLLTGLGIGGIAIAFAMQESLANIFGGISIILDKSVNVDDLVNLEDGTSGKIVNIGLRSTKVKTYDNEIVVVPNSKLSTGIIHNVAQPDPIVRVVVPFGVAYGSDPDKVKDLVLKEIKKVKHIVQKPGPFVKFLEMGDSSLNFKAYFFVETFDVRLGALDEANTRIYNALNKAGIEIPFPQMDINLKK